MTSDAWPGYCRALLAASISSAARQFPGRGEMAAGRVHGLRKTLKEARALARLFLQSAGEPARVTITSLAAARRRVASARDLDVIEARLIGWRPAGRRRFAQRRHRAGPRGRQAGPHDARDACEPRAARSDREADRGGRPRGHERQRHRLGGRPHLPAGAAGAAGSPSPATIRPSCTPCGRGWSTSATSLRRCRRPGRRR